MGDILSGLRAATGGAHQQLEDAVGIEHRVQDRAGYRRLLEIFLGFYRPLEARFTSLHGWAQSGIDLAARRKTPWLEEDLSALGLTGREIDALPACAELPCIGDSLDRGFGCLYVLEGATLGGRHITTMMQDSSVPSAARRFFASYGAETGTRWREFIAALENHANAAPEADPVKIVQGAQETFACLQHWFVRECAAHEQHPG